MNVLGWFLAFAGFVGVIVGLLQMLKGKKMNRVPFRAPSEVAQLGPGAADAKGLVSTEGSVGEQGLLVAPMSGKPCLAYQITVERKWEKSERTENGTQTKKGSDTVHREYKGGVFAINDGAGSLWVDASTHEPDASFDKSFTAAINGGLLGFPGTLQFGGYSIGTPSLALAEGHTKAFEGTEKIIPPSPTLYALGQVQPTPNGPVLATPKGIGTGKLILSNKGRASLLKATKRNMILGYALGGVLFVGGTGLGIFGPKTDPSTGKMACNEIQDAVSCDGRIYERDGKDHKWTVTQAGEYTLTVSQPNVKYPIWAELTVKDASGKEIANVDAIGKGSEAKVKQKFEPGTYTLNVKDTLRDKVSGGYGFHLDIVKSAEPEPVAAAATINNADVPPVDTAKKGAVVPAKGTLTINANSKGIKPASAPAATTAAPKTDSTAAPAAPKKDAPAPKPAAAPAAKKQK